jgi:hypothetical protein
MTHSCTLNGYKETYLGNEARVSCNKTKQKSKKMQKDGVWREEPRRVAKDEMTNLETSFTDIIIGSLNSYIQFNADLVSVWKGTNL